MPTRTRRQVSEVGLAVIAGILMVALPGAAQQLTNDQLSLTVNAQEGSYQLSSSSSLHDGQPVLKSRVAAQVDHQWLRSSDYPRHQASESSFQDDLGSGPQVTVTCSGLSGKPDLVYVLRLYKQRAYGTVLVKVQNSAGREVTVQAIRSVEAMGEPIVNLGGGQSADRVLSDSFSEDWPDLALYDLGERPAGCIAVQGANSSTTGRASRVYSLARSPQTDF
jgi:alpha-galactosidase